MSTQSSFSKYLHQIFAYVVFLVLNLCLNIKEKITGLPSGKISDVEGKHMYIRTGFICDGLGFEPIHLVLELF